MSAFEAVAALLEGGFVVVAPLDEAFPLFSPLGEKSWVPNWDPELLYPRGVSWMQGLRTEDAAMGCVDPATSGHAPRLMDQTLIP